MVKVLNKYRNIYVFIIILSFIGLSSGYLYYQVQSDVTKNELISIINMKKELSSGVNNIPKRLNVILKTFIYSVTILPQVISIFNLFYKPFEVGFILNLLDSFSLKFSLIYISVYHLIPLIMNLFLIKVGFILSKNIIEVIIFRDRLSIKNVKIQIKKYFLLSFIFLFYEILILLFSSNINAYLMTILS